MRGTRWRDVLRDCAGRIHRELRVSLTPVPSPDRWVFIVGCYNSGTTLLGRLLDRHPQVSALPQEGQFLTDQFHADYTLGLPRMWVLREDHFRLTEDDAGPDVVRLKKEWGMRLDTRKRVLVEKSPPNAARTRWLQRQFENAHFVAVVRNGYAVSEGIRRKGDPKHRHGWPLEDCVRQWVRSNQVLLEDAPHLRHLLWVRYEDLTERPREELGRILEFLGLDPEDLEFDGSDRFRVHERHEALRNLNSESIARLEPAERDRITRAARPMLEHFGYEVL